MRSILESKRVAPRVVHVVARVDSLVSGPGSETGVGIKLIVGTRFLSAPLSSTRPAWCPGFSPHPDASRNITAVRSTHEGSAPCHDRRQGASRKALLSHAPRKLHNELTRLWSRRGFRCRCSVRNRKRWRAGTCSRLDGYSPGCCPVFVATRSRVQDPISTHYGRACRQPGPHHVKPREDREAPEGSAAFAGRGHGSAKTIPWAISDGRDEVHAWLIRN
jgi:hypothetical protein